MRYDAIKQRLARADGGAGATATRTTIAAASADSRRRRRRARRSITKRAMTRARPSAFVELNAAELFGASPATGAVVEVEDKSGVRVTVRLADEAYGDLG